MAINMEIGWKRVESERKKYKVTIQTETCAQSPLYIHTHAPSHTQNDKMCWGKHQTHYLPDTQADAVGVMPERQDILKGN